MKKPIHLIILFSILISSACTGNSNPETKENTRVLMENTTDEQGLQRMQVSRTEQTVSLKGNDYKISLARIPDDNLPIVDSEVGDKFVDNKITLNITQGGKNVIDRTFTKKDFSSIAGEQFLQKSILEGMVFDKVTPQGMVFAVSISYPQTDLYFPISLTVSADGKTSMKKDELMEEIYTSEE